MVHAQYCAGYLAQPMYCASKCFTGGCGSKGDMVFEQEGPFCQPCDACGLDTNVPFGDCPARCREATALPWRRKLTRSPKEGGNEGDAERKLQTGKVYREYNAPGSFTLSM